MIELPLVSLDLARTMVQNFAIIATMLLLYDFIPDSVRSGSRLRFSLYVGIVFGVTAFISMPELWQDTGGSVIGVNFILVPLSAIIGGPVSAVFVASVLLAGSATSSGSLAFSDILTILGGILLGTVFYSDRSGFRLSGQYSVRLIALGAGVALIELVVFVFFSGQQTPGDNPPGITGIITMLSFIVISGVGTVLLGSIIWVIDRKKETERELHEYKDHLEGLVRDRTAELRQANSLQRATIESTADGIVVVDRECVVRAYNQKASAILELPVHPPKDGDGAGQFPKIVAPLLADPAEFLPFFRALPDSAEQVISTGLRFKNNRIYELYVHPQQIGDHSFGRVFSFHDITRKKLAEDAITAANAKLMLLSELTRHDILNQMTVIIAYLDLLEMDNHDPAMSAHISAMKKSLEVIRFQLEFTRDYQDLGLRKPDWQAIETAFTTAAGPFGDRNTTITYEAGTVEVFADPMIGQVFRNLMDNSLRHGGKGLSGIRLSVSKDDPDLLLVYVDNGIGVPPEEKERIFDKGFGKHTGLGMFLIKEILSITGITIRETGSFGQGARFEIRVPAGKYRFP
ncbi:MAG: ATP-binding protein [Methanoregula sp.]|nr:ATP-binding protein [Methanoregula sp.]